MKKVLKIQDLDCANCALKIEERVSKLDGVENASVNFLTQKISLEIDDDRSEDILKSIQKVVKSVEPNSTLIF